MTPPSPSPATNGAGAERSRSPIPWAVAAALLFVASLAIRWPGIAMYDSVAQYSQALDGDYSDWHPPVMARLWALLNHIHRGTQPFFAIQMALWWGGLGLLSAVLGRRQRHGGAACVLLVGLCPLWLGWATVVLKDAQMAACLVAAAGIVAWWRLAERPMPRGAAAIALILIGYATLVRGNAVFATVPFAFALLGWGRLRRGWQRAGAVIVVMLAVIAISPLINRRLLGAEASGVEHSLMVYDLAGIGHNAHLATIPRATPAQWAEAERRGCYTSYFWNPYGEPAQCDFLGQAVAMGEDAPPGVARDWIGAILRHPLAYAQHRLGHLNDNLRLWVAMGEPDAVPPVNSEPNQLGLGTRGAPAGQALIVLARGLAASPIGWPAVWVTVAIGLLWASAGAPRTGQARLGCALALSAACMGASFAVVSIASDLRYHLWTMVAAAMALILLADARAFDRRRARLAGAAVLAVIAIGTVARLGLAAPAHVPLPAHVPAPGA